MRQFDLMILGPATRDVNIDFTGAEDRSVGGAVYDAIDIVRIYECVDGIFVGNVKFIHISVEENVLAVSFLQQLDFVSKLAVAASYQNVHVV